MDEMVKDLAQSRKDVADWSMEVARLEKLVAETDPGKALAAARQHLAAAKSGEIEADGTLRAAALTEYERTGEKKPHPATTVTRRRKLEYDEDAARTYCLRRFPQALRLLKGEFEKIAKKVRPGFVRYDWTTSVSVSKDLWSYLEEESDGL